MSDLVQRLQRYTQGCLEGLWQPNIMQNEAALRVNSANAMSEAATELSRLRAEVEALRKDAERWRMFLSTRPANTHEVICAAIDAAMGSQP